MKRILAHPLASNRAVWLTLVGATLLSYGSSIEAGSSNSRIAGSVVLLIAFFKARLIGLRFMELQTGVLPLRLLFEFWIIAMGTVLLVLFWL